MKRLLFICLLGISVSSHVYCQSAISYTDVITVSDASADDLYKKALQWFVYTFKSSSNVIQHKDPTAKLIIGNATVKYDTKVFMSQNCTSGYIDYVIKLEFKDNRFKYTITDFYHRGSGIGCNGQAYEFGYILTSEPCNNNYYPPARLPKSFITNLCSDMKSVIDREAKSLIVSLTNDLPKIQAAPSDDW